MKQWNNKQIAASETKRSKSMHRYGLAIVGLSFLAFLVAFGVYALTHPGCATELAKFFGIGLYGTGIYAVLPAMVSLDSVDPEDARGNNIKYRIWLLRQDECDMDNYPSPSGKTIGSLVLKAGKYWHYIDCEENSVKPNAASEGQVPSMKLTVGANLWGLNDAIMSFLFDNNGAYFFLVWENCSTGVKYLAGSPCSRMKMTVTRMGSDENWTGAALEFTNTCPDPFLRYTGTLATNAPQTIAADATVIALAAGKNQYQLTDGTVSAKNITAFTGMAAADHLRVIDILGSGGTYPSTIDDDDDFILEGGETWTANAGSKLTVQVFKDGAATYKFIEVPGTRIA